MKLVMAAATKRIAMTMVEVKRNFSAPRRL
jgi:hypothetical protein